MAVTVKLRYLRIAPRKVRLVADLIRGKTVEESKSTLQFLAKRAARPLFKLLNSAIASAKNNFQLEESILYISKILVDEGPKLKRWRARARGRAAPIEKKTSHITLVLEEIKGKKKTKKVVKKEKKPVKKEIKPKETKKTPDLKKPKVKPELKSPKPIGRVGKGIRKIFRRKAF